MALVQLLAGKDVFVGLEITPPRSRRPDVLLRRASLLDGLAAVVNVIQRPDRQSSLDASCDLRAAGLTPVWHLVARGDEARDLPRAFERAAAAGVTDVLCILGDRTGIAPLKVRELVAATRAALPGASIGATVNQYSTGENTIANLLGKIEAGASFVETQPVFSLDSLAPVVTRTSKEIASVRFIALAMPVLTPASAARMEARLGFAIPRDYLERVAKGPEAAWGAFAANLRALRESGLVAGIAIMTPEMDPPLATRDRIRQAVMQAGLAPATAH